MFGFGKSRVDIQVAPFDVLSPDAVVERIK